MASKPTSQRSSSRRSQSGASRNGKHNGDGLRPAQQARREINEADREYRKYVHEEEKDRVGPPDVVLDVPELRVDSIHLEVDELDAHLALKARVLNLVKLNVGIDIHLSRVKLDVKGVEAEVVLKARLDHVTAIVDRLMTSLDRNPELVKGLSKAVSEVGRGAGEAVDKTGDAAKDIGQGAQGQPNGATPPTPRPGTVAKEVAKLVAREIGHAASDEARDVSLAAARKVREIGERREQRRADKYKATEAAMRVADELGIDLASLDGTGSDGRITVKDVREAQEA
jgi:e3 binding domain